MWNASNGMSGSFNNGYIVPYILLFQEKNENVPMIWALYDWNTLKIAQMVLTYHSYDVSNQIYMWTEVDDSPSARVIRIYKHKQYTSTQHITQPRQWMSSKRW